MAEKVNLVKQVYQRTAFTNTVDTQFDNQTGNEFTQQIQTPSTQEFFNYYDLLFYQIPKEGPASHTTLIQRSQEYVGNQQINEEIDALIQEINGLRETVLQQQETIFNLTISGSV